MVIKPFNFSRPVASAYIIPRTYSDGLTYAEEMAAHQRKLQELADYINRVVESLPEEIASQIAPLSQRVTDLELATLAALEAMNIKVDEAVSTITNSTIEVSDPVVMGVISDEHTTSHEYLVELITSIINEENG